MAQSDILEYLQNQDEPVPRRKICEDLGLNPKQVSKDLRKLMDFNFVKFEYRYDTEVKKKIWFYYAIQ